MAKSKRSAALFEVIQSSRISLNARPSKVSRWFGRSARIAAPLPTATPSAPTEGLPDAIEAEAIPSVTESAPPAPSLPKSPIAGVDLQLDSDRQLVTFKLSYNSAIVTAFSVLVAICLAFMVGRKMNHARIAATASPSSDELRSQPAHPDVLDVGSSSLVKQTELITPSPAGDGAELAGAKSATTAPSPVDAQRVVGRDYVIVQIYPEKKSADDAASLLNKNSIPCTVENGVVGWASKSWWCVVGTTGFDHIRGNSEYERYETAINRVSEQFAPNSKFKKFEPRAYRWKESAT